MCEVSWNCRWPDTGGRSVLACLLVIMLADCVSTQIEDTPSLGQPPLCSG